MEQKASLYFVWIFGNKIKQITKTFRMYTENYFKHISQVIF